MKIDVWYKKDGMVNKIDIKNRGSDLIIEVISISINRENK